MASPDFDVGIIGYGPVGATLANLLGQSGLKTVALEREPSVYHLPRAVSLDGEGMRLFQTMGLAEALLPKLSVSRNIRHVSADGKLLLLIARSGTGPEGWHNAYRFYQPELETILREGVSRFPRLTCGFAAKRSRSTTRATTSVFVMKTSNPAPFPKSRPATSLVATAPARRCGASWARSCRTCARMSAGSCSTYSRQAAGWRAGSRRRDRPCRRRDPVLRSGSADDLRTDAGQAPPLGIHADAAGRPGDDHVSGVHLRDARAVEHRSRQIEDRTRRGLHVPLRALDAWRRGRLLLAGDAAHQMPRSLGKACAQACATRPIWLGSCAT